MSASNPTELTDYYRASEKQEIAHVTNLYGGKGTIDITTFFRRDAFAMPALLLIYAIPPGASEGVHTHSHDDSEVGSFDEFYYIIAGRGEMQVNGAVVTVTAGDYVFVPNGVAHGIENTSDRDMLKLHLTALQR